MIFWTERQMSKLVLNIKYLLLLSFFNCVIAMTEKSSLIFKREVPALGLLYPPLSVRPVPNLNFNIYLHN